MDFRGRPARARRAAAVGVLLAIAGLCGCGAGDGAGEPGPAFTEPTRLSSERGVLEVRLIARQGTARFDTVAEPVRNALLFSYELIRGHASNGRRTDDDLYPGPTLHVAPGETLIVHLENELQGLTIPDFLNPAFTPAGQAVPLYPPALAAAPLNLHTHGLHVSPAGNSDNVLLDIPPGASNTYTYRVPPDMPEGLNWYHSHRHQLTAAQTYGGLAGLLQIGRADGNIPSVTRSGIPIRTMAIQYNYIFDRRGGLAQLNNPNWPQYVSTLQGPVGTQLADGTYQPKLAPVNFAQAAKGTTYFTNWWEGPLGTANNRGRFQFMPSNLQRFTSDSGGPGVAENPSLSDRWRDVQFTVNGQFQPRLQAAPGQTEIWVLANISDFAYVNVTLTETATGRHPPIAIVGQDGNPYTDVHYPPTPGGATLLLPAGARYAIAVTMPARGELVLEIPPLVPYKTRSLSGPAILYTADGTETPPAGLGTVRVETTVVSYIDGFFVFPTQVLARVEPTSGRGSTVPFLEGQPLHAYTSFVDTQGITPAVRRILSVSGGFDNNYASNEDPKAFVYQFNGNAFPYIPLIQPRLGTVEEWSIVNFNNDQHPIHVHVNDFQVSRLVDPVAGIDSGFQPWGQDVANLPAPLMDAFGAVIAPSELSLRTRFTQFTGSFVIHCHRLNHEDNGLMALVNVIPAVSSFAVAAAGSGDAPASVRVYDAQDDRLLATVTPFADLAAAPSVAMGDVDGDQVLDLIVGAGPGGAPEIVVYSGSGAAGAAPFTTELIRFPAFDETFRGGVQVAAADIEADALRDNIIAAPGPGIDAEVKVFAADLEGLPWMPAPDVFASFLPYARWRGGVSVAAGLVDALSGRASIVTAPGPGTPALIKAFRFDLYGPNTGATSAHGVHQTGAPATTAEFLAFDAGYLGGISLATGWLAGLEGGVQRILAGQLSSPGRVRVFSSGSALSGQPEFYTQSPDQHGAPVTFTEMAGFVPFPQSLSGIRLAATSTPHGADLLISGVSSAGTEVEVRKYDLVRSRPDATVLAPLPLGQVESAPGTEPASLGGA